MTFQKDATTVTLKGAIYPFTLNFSHHQNVGIAEDGSVRVYDRNVTEKFIGIKFKDTDAKLTSIRNFINDTVKYAKETFTFTPDPGVDAGAGAGNAVTVRYWSDKFRENMRHWHLFYYDMILRVEL